MLKKALHIDQQIRKDFLIALDNFNAERVYQILFFFYLLRISSVPNLPLKTCKKKKTRDNPNIPINQDFNEV